jgi:carboxyl-terminal processing protease
MAGPVEGFNPSRLGRTLWARQTFQDFAQRFTAEGDERIAGGKNRRNIKPGFQVDDAMVAEYKKFLIDEERVKMDEAAWTADAAFIRGMIRFGIDEALFGIDVARRRLLADDPQAQFALNQFAEAEKLSRLSQNKRTTASRQPQ